MKIVILKRKKGSIFQSIQSLQKNSAKFSAKRDACDEKSTGARNDYLLTLAASNAHQRRYYEVDFERFLRTMECDMYDKVAEYLTLMSRTELLTCSATQSSFNKIKEQATTVRKQDYLLSLYYPKPRHFPFSIWLGKMELTPSRWMLKKPACMIYGW
ncbi:F-BAR and double SH3 domains protein 2 [Portunus trituberculatus]|uniref:F-BAR and double SH3 domains protein 2 n=1 Tax=Portunus trituberculatus TaxID=210409 RepID=A0A5B7FKT7_PORTR|nr:F-BAR and double SH3 domains protein 2 [Portunus trituberculatus]